MTELNHSSDLGSLKSKNLDQRHGASLHDQSKAEASKKPLIDPRKITLEKIPASDAPLDELLQLRRLVYIEETNLMDESRLFRDNDRVGVLSGLNRHT